MLKSRWPLAPIEELCERVTSGGTPSRSNPVYYEGGTIPWIKTGELRGWYVDDIAERITPAAVRESSAKVFPPGTVLLAMYGDGKTMGSVGMIRAPAATNQACCAMLVDPQKCDPKFLMYSLVYFKPAILKLAISGAQRNLNGKSIKQFAIGAPPVEVQQRIASILSAYDDLIENNTRRIAILEEMARRIYEEWFVRFRFPGHEGVRMVESELGLVPEGWAPMTLGELVEFQKGKKPAAVFTEWAPGRAPALLIDALRRGSVEFADSDRLVSVARSDTIMVMDGSGSAQVFIGHEGVIGSTLGRYRVITGAPVGAFWIYLFFLTHQLDIGGKNIGAAIPHANKDYIRSMPVSAPADQTAAQFEDLVKPMFDLIQNLKAKNAKLRASRDLLLPKLISGELDVSALPEPEALAA